MPPHLRRFYLSPQPISREKGGDLDGTRIIKTGAMEDSETMPTSKDELRHFVYERSAVINEYARHVGDINRFAEPKEREKILSRLEREGRQELELKRWREMEILGMGTGCAGGIDPPFGFGGYRSC